MTSYNICSSFWWFALVVYKYTSHVIRDAMDSKFLDYLNRRISSPAAGFSAKCRHELDVRKLHA